MKRIKIVTITATSIILAAIIIFVACKKDSDRHKDKIANQKNYSNYPEDPAGDYCWLPDDATIEEDFNNQIITISSNNWTYIGTTSDNQLLTLNNGEKIKISCLCNSSGTCFPFYAEGFAGCSGTCTNCTMTQTVAATGAHITHGGYVNLNTEPYFLTENEDLPTAFDEMFDLSVIQNKINTFLSTVYEGYAYPELIDNGDYTLTPEGYSFAVVNLCGRAIVIPIPDAILPQNSISGNKYQCSCTNGSCQHKIEKIIVHYCKDNCSGTCTMTVSDAMAPGIDDSIRFSSISFQY